MRKVNEMSIALSLEKRFNKDELLEMYLNHIYMGRQQYGVKAAARYFGHEDLHQLELWQIATLAGIPKGPSIYNPVDDDERSKHRRSVILTLMYEQGLITQNKWRKRAAWTIRRLKQHLCQLQQINLCRIIYLRWIQ